MSSTKMPVSSLIRVRDAERRMLVGLAYQDENGNIRLHLDITPPDGHAVVHKDDEAPKEHAIFSPLFQYVYDQLRSHAGSGLTSKQERHVLQILTNMIDCIPGFRQWIESR